MPTFKVMLTLGVEEDGEPIFHASIKPPTRLLAPLNATYQESELSSPGQGIDIGYTPL